jgi:hypothetical protein
MFVHSVYFWLKPEMTADQRVDFARDLQTLRDIETVRGCWIGTPAPADRPVIDSSYDFGLILVFDNKADEESYLAHPLHRAFADTWRTFWTVKIHDCVE